MKRTALLLTAFLALPVPAFAFGAPVNLPILTFPDTAPPAQPTQACETPLNIGCR